MNILKVLGVVVGIHVVAYLVIAQPGCRSTAAKPAPTATASAPAAPSLGEPATAGELRPDAPELAPIALHLPFAQAGAPAGERFAPTRPGAEPPPAEATPAKTYTVQKGDSFYTIARKHGLTVPELTAANNLSSGASLRPGQKLAIPGKGGKAAAADSSTVAAKVSAAAPAAGGSTYTVKSGDTLSKIASRHRTTSAVLRSLNGISGDHLRIGQVIQLPGNAAAAPAPVLPPPPAAAPVGSGSVAPAAAGSGVHTVAAGESAESIARLYQISVGELVRANQITDPRRIRIGQVRVLPGSGAARAAVPPPSLVPDLSAPPAPPVEAVAPVAAPEEDAPVIRVDEPPPAVPAPQID